MLVRVIADRALLYVLNPLHKTYSPKGKCFKAKGTETTVERLNGNVSFLRIIVNNSQTTLYLRATDVAEVTEVEAV